MCNLITETILFFFLLRFSHISLIPYFNFIVKDFCLLLAAREEESGHFTTMTQGTATSDKIKVVYCEDGLLHNPPFEVTSGKIKPYVESPERLKSIKKYIDENPSMFQLISPISDYTLKPILDIHRPDYIAFLESIYQEWVNAGLPKDACIGDTFAQLSFASKLSEEVLLKNANQHPTGKMGYYLGDMSVSFMNETWRAAYASVQIVLTAAHELLRSIENSEANDKQSKMVYALCRPPGHHSSDHLAAGYCFINNAAVAAAFLQNYSSKDMELLQRPYDPVLATTTNLENMMLDEKPIDEKKKILILDIDYHHGNGTQEIFYDDSTVFYISIHGYPDYPHFTGSVDEKGRGRGLGYNINIPLDPEHTTDEVYLKHLYHVLNTEKTVVNFKADIVIVSLGLDTWFEDPIAGMKGLREKHTYYTIGQYIKQSEATFGKPVLFVQEGGYTYDKLGELVGQVLQGFACSSDEKLRLDA
ncbi:hypothetical protein BDF20DRAFT_857293 [Mycotypha africana]|uniref:uncharacterized protein n=1 Tax=Mycotypha africana TaxID=64632 RepID=UPI002300B64B|nr:uncharacterized protein BDF20DRAFT_857293 [Mycotypha africana]KAI8983978.1 hypothetical protein BDF20DRAFT_857293 [Mycotypha africana]